MNVALCPCSAQMDKDDALARKQALCSHVNTTTSGSNAYYFRKSCKDCDKMLERYKKTSSAMTSSTADAKKATSTCPHYDVSWHGPNGHRWKQTCKDCGDVKTGPVKGRDAVSKDGAGTTSSTSSRAPPRVYPGTINVSNTGMMMHIFDVALKLREDRCGPSGELPIDEVISSLEVAISVTNQKQSPPTASSRVSNNKMPLNEERAGALYDSIRGEAPRRRTNSSQPWFLQEPNLLRGLARSSLCQMVP